MVGRHCELLKPGEACRGGGFYELDYITHCLLLSGASSEYGEPEWEDFESITLSAYYRRLHIVYTSWDSWKKEFHVSDRLRFFTNREKEYTQNVFPTNIKYNIIRENFRGNSP